METYVKFFKQKVNIFYIFKHVLTILHYDYIKRK